MGFLDSVVVPGTPKATSSSTPKKGSGTFLSSVVMADNQVQADKLAQFEKESQAAKAVAEQANSFGGIFKQTISNIWDTTKKYVVDSGKQAANFGVDLITHPIKTLQKEYNAVPDHIIEAFKTSFNQGTDVVGQMLQDYKNGTGSTSGDIANLARLTSAVAGVIFSPVSGTLEAAQDFPVLKQVADAVNVPFTITGLAGAYASGKVVDMLPISQESKNTLKKPIEDLGSLAAQVFVGGRIMAKAADVIQAGREITPAESQRIINEIKVENPEVFGLPSPIKEGQLALPPGRAFLDTIQLPGDVMRKGTKSHADYAKEQGYEPYVPPSELPVIEVGKKAKTAEPVVQIEPPARKVKNDLVYEPVPVELQPLASVARKYDTAKEFIKAVEDRKMEVPKEVVPDASAAPAAKKEALTTFYKKTTTPAAPAAEVKVGEPLGSGEKQQSTLARKVEANAIEKKLVSTFGNLPEYRRVNMKEQADFATDFLALTPERALAVALGKEASPTHILPEMVFKAVEERALANKDVATLRALATESKLSLEATAMGQRIRALGEREQNSPVDMIQNIRDARVKAIERKSKGSVEKQKKQIAKEIEKEIKQAVSKRPTWEEFIKEVQCKY